MTTLLKSSDVCKIYGIARPTLNDWVADGCPVAKRGKGRAQSQFDAAKLATWAAAAGKRPRGIEGAAIAGRQPVAKPARRKRAAPKKTAKKPAAKRKQAKKPKSKPPDKPEQPKQPDTEPPVELTGLTPDKQLAAVRQQYIFLHQRFVQAAKTGADDLTMASITRALAAKGPELRQLEMAVLDWRQRTGQTYDAATINRVFVELATGTRDRVMGVANSVIPRLRRYLRDDDDAGAVQEIIDEELRHALTALPAELPDQGEKTP